MEGSGLHDVARFSHKHYFVAQVHKPNEAAKFEAGCGCRQSLSRVCQWSVPHFLSEFDYRSGGRFAFAALVSCSSVCSNRVAAMDADGVVYQPAHQWALRTNRHLESVLQSVSESPCVSLHCLHGPLYGAVALGIAHGGSFEDDFPHQCPAQGLQESHECRLLIIFEDHSLVPEAVDVAAHSSGDKADFSIIHAFVRHCVGEHAAGDLVVHDEHRGKSSCCLAAFVLGSSAKEPVVERKRWHNICFPLDGSVRMIPSSSPHAMGHHDRNAACVRLC